MSRSAAVALAAACYVAVAAGWSAVAWRPHKENAMGWSSLGEVTVDAKPRGAWTWAADYVEGPALIKIEVDPETATWHYSPGRECTADGDLNALITARNGILPDAPIGALIGKIGGSTAGVKDGKLFLVGRHAIIKVDKDTGGPLLLTINDELTGLADNSGSLKARISISMLPAPAPSAAPAASQGASP